MLTRSSNSFSPSRFPPPFFVRKLRPSSASRASNAVHHPLEQPGGCGGLEDHGVLARLERLRARGTLGLLDACTHGGVRVELCDAADVAADPARPAAVSGAHRARIVEIGRPLVTEIAVAVGEGGETRAIGQEARRDQLVRAAWRDGLGRDRRPVLRRDRRDTLVVAWRRLVALLFQRRHELLVFRRELRQFLRAAHGARKRSVVELIDRGDADALAVGHLHLETGVADHAAGGHVVEGEAHVAVDRSGEPGRAFVGLGQPHDLLEDGAGVLFGEIAHS